MTRYINRHTTPTAAAVAMPAPISSAAMEAEDEDLTRRTKDEKAPKGFEDGRRPSILDTFHDLPPIFEDGTPPKRIINIAPPLPPRPDLQQHHQLQQLQLHQTAQQQDKHHQQENEQQLISENGLSSTEAPTVTTSIKPDSLAVGRQDNDGFGDIVQHRSLTSTSNVKSSSTPIVEEWTSIDSMTTAETIKFQMDDMVANSQSVTELKLDDVIVVKQLPKSQMNDMIKSDSDTLTTSTHLTSVVDACVTESMENIFLFSVADTEKVFDVNAGDGQSDEENPVRDEDEMKTGDTDEKKTDDVGKDKPSASTGAEFELTEVPDMPTPRPRHHRSAAVTTAVTAIGGRTRIRSRPPLPPIDYFYHQQVSGQVDNVVPVPAAAIERRDRGSTNPDDNLNTTIAVLNLDDVNLNSFGVNLNSAIVNFDSADVNFHSVDVDLNAANVKNPEPTYNWSADEFTDTRL